MAIFRKDPRNMVGWRIEVNFTINLHERDRKLLNRIQYYFGGIGVISSVRDNCCNFTVTSLNQILTVILPHFDKYPLISKKHADYLLFKEVVNMMNRKEHLTYNGLQSILNAGSSYYE